jgi:uncharacterized protein
MPAKSSVAAVIFIAGIAFSAGAQQPLTIPPPTGVVNDFAHLLDQATFDKITRIAEDVRTKSRGEIAVVTLSDIGNREATDVAMQIGRQWKVGKIGNPGDATRNAGAVILLVPKETNSDGRGRCFISTGQGTEGFITDATAGDICREATPAFIRKDYAAGLELVTLRTAERFAKEFNFSIDTSLAAPPLPSLPPANVQYPRDSGGGIPPFFYFILIFVIISVLSNLSGRRGRGRRRQSGCGGCLWPIVLSNMSSGRGSWGSSGGLGGGGWGGGGWGGGGGFGGGGGGGGFGGFGGGGGFSGGGGGSSW